MHPIRTLILLANEHHMRLLTHAGRGEPLLQVAHHAADEFSDDAVRYSDREGRMKNGPGPISALDRSTSERAQERGHFVDHVLDVTEKTWAEGHFDRFIMAAPAKMLGDLRDDLKGPLKEALHADLDSDLLKTPLADMPSHLAALVAL